MTVFFTDLVEEGLEIFVLVDVFGEFAFFELCETHLRRQRITQIRRFLQRQYSFVKPHNRYSRDLLHPFFECFVLCGEQVLGFIVGPEQLGDALRSGGPFFVVAVFATEEFGGFVGPRGDFVF